MTVHASHKPAPFRSAASVRFSHVPILIILCIILLQEIEIVAYFMVASLVHSSCLRDTCKGSVYEALILG